ncbi:hypothetical protein NQZ79_g7337 [Umbelopsis isabellina]|nr:hypothetical protein NQZ79_g7337 [Umbelopsis isabellina]
MKLTKDISGDALKTLFGVLMISSGALANSFCSTQGAHTCALIVADDVTSTGLTGAGPSESSSATVVNSQCQQIVASGSLDPKSPGFSGSFKLTYGPTLYVGATWISSTEISGISYQYNGKSYTQSNCWCHTVSSWNSGGRICQCAFDC